MKPQDNTDSNDWLTQIFYDELRGKTVTPEQEDIIGWAEKRLKQAILAKVDELVRLARKNMYYFGFDARSNPILTIDTQMDMDEAVDRTVKFYKEYVRLNRQKEVKQIREDLIAALATDAQPDMAKTIKTVLDNRQAELSTKEQVNE